MTPTGYGKVGAKNLQRTLAAAANCTFFWSTAIGYPLRSSRKSCDSELQEVSTAFARASAELQRLVQRFEEEIRPCGR